MREDKRITKIQSVLTQGENIEKCFDLNDCQVYATNKRLLRLEDNNVRDFDYGHISSVGYSPKRYWLLAILGLLIGIFGYYIGYVYDEVVIITVGIIIGIIFIIIGIFYKTEFIATNVIGADSPIVYKGHRQELDSLLKIIREKQNTTQSRDITVSNEQDFTVTLRKLAELKEEGIITQEEFENKKTQILGNSV
ncbi:MAG: SHOCT domain-containing protein [Dehalococcoidia bacterium]|jgi:hypothetical protein